MKRHSFEVVAWCNGSVGYGLTMSAATRDAYFMREWYSVGIYLPGRSEPTKVNVDKDSLWNGCRHLISKEIRAWLFENGMAPWPKGHPPRFKLVQRAPSEFELTFD
jgi:hypothetical protein